MESPLCIELNGYGQQLTAAKADVISASRGKRSDASDVGMHRLFRIAAPGLARVTDRPGYRLVHQ
jgi:hypothetical protein